MDIFACGEQTPRQNDAVVTTPITTEGDSEEVRLFDCVVFAIIPTGLGLARSGAHACRHGHDLPL
jgi:hypothetical protein